MTLPVPYYDEGGVTIYHGDCREALEAIGPVGLCLTDPPYGFGAYESDVEPSSELLAQIVQGATTSAVFGYPETLVSWCVGLGRVPDEWVVWWPTNKMGARGSRAGLPRESEHVAIFGAPCGGHHLRRPRSTKAIGRAIASSRGNDHTTARLGDVWHEASPGMGFNHHLRLHPNEKPLCVMERLVLLCSEAAETVLDPFMGSGTTLLAARDLGRRAIGIEIEERYCEIAANRLQQAAVAAA